MSLISKVESIFSSFDKEFVKLFGSAPAVLTTVSGTLTVVAPLISTILVITGNEPAALAVSAVVVQVQADLATAQTLIKSTGNTPTVTAVLNAIVTNLKSLLTAGDIKDSKTLGEVTVAVNTVVAEVEAIISALKAVPAAV
jgi:hypothetical protein